VKKAKVQGGILNGEDRPQAVRSRSFSFFPFCPKKNIDEKESGDYMPHYESLICID